VCVCVCACVCVFTPTPPRLSIEFDKWAECIMRAIAFCVPEASVCNADSHALLVPSSFMTQERRAVLQEVTMHLLQLFHCPLQLEGDGVGDLPLFLNDDEDDPFLAAKQALADRINCWSCDGQVWHVTRVTCVTCVIPTTCVTRVTRL